MYRKYRTYSQPNADMPLLSFCQQEESVIHLSCSSSSPAGLTALTVIYLLFVSFSFFHQRLSVFFLWLFACFVFFRFLLFSSFLCLSGASASSFNGPRSFYSLAALASNPPLCVSLSRVSARLKLGFGFPVETIYCVKKAGCFLVGTGLRHSLALALEDRRLRVHEQKPLKGPFAGYRSLHLQTSPRFCL